MSDEINYHNNPLHGVGLETLLTELVEYYGFEILNAYLNFKCFSFHPSIKSSVKFFKKTQWAREKVEAFYMYQYKNLPRASSEQFLLPPRDRIVPDSHKPGPPKELSLEDAEQLRQKRAKKAAEREKEKQNRSKRFEGSKKEKRSPAKNGKRSQMGGRTSGRNKLENLPELISNTIDEALHLKDKTEKRLEKSSCDQVTALQKTEFQGYVDAFFDAIIPYKSFVNTQLIQVIDALQDKVELIDEAIKYNSISILEAYDELLDLQKEFQGDIIKFI